MHVSVCRGMLAFLPRLRDNEGVDSSVQQSRSGYYAALVATRPELVIAGWTLHSNAHVRTADTEYRRAPKSACA